MRCSSEAEGYGVRMSGARGVRGIGKFQTFLHTVNAEDMSDAFMMTSEQRP